MEKDFAAHLAKLRAAAEVRTITPREMEQKPDYHQRQVEREGRSPMSGGNFGGGTWGGRSRSQGEQP